MNAQTITTRTNSKHFSQNSNPKIKVATAPPVSDFQEHQPENKSVTPAKSAPQTAVKLASGIHSESSSAGSAQETSFRVDAPSAQEVLLAGEFTEWDKAPIKLIKGGGGVWHTKVSLAPGRHQYRFLVDGQWQDDSHRPGREPNSFGSSNSVVEVI